MAVDLGGALVLSARNGLESGGETAPARSSIATQARVAYSRIEAALGEAGYGRGEVLHLTEYVAAAALDGLGEVERARRDRFADTGPAVSIICVERLAHPGALIQVDATARRTGGANSGHPLGDLVFLDSQLPLDPGGEVVEIGDFVAQAERIFERAGESLRAAGLSWRNVVKQINYITPSARPEYRRIADVRRGHLGPVFPAATTVVVERLCHPDALLQAEFIASRSIPSAIDPWGREGMTSSPAVRAGDVLFVSGQTARDHRTGVIAPLDDVVGQAEGARENIRTILEAAGARPEDLVRTVQYVTEPALARYPDPVRALPASTIVGCRRLLGEGSLIEIDAVAVLRRQA